MRTYDEWVGFLQSPSVKHFRKMTSHKSWLEGRIGSEMFREDSSWNCDN